MSALLQKLHLAPVRGSAPLSGLVSVQDESLPPDSIPEIVAKRAATFLKGRKDDSCAAIDFIFFRRFDDGRSPQVTAYIVDNSRKQYTGQQIAELHRRVWLNGTAPLLYVEHPTQVDVLRCAAGPEFWDKREEQPAYHAAAEISDALETDKINRFSAFRLATGTFWEAPGNANWACAKKAAHKRLIDAVIEADRNLKGNASPVMRRLLLLFIFTKYLEDRGVFPLGWFQDYSKGANTFLDVLKAGKPKAVLKMLAALKTKFNGDIFELPEIRESLNSEILAEFTSLLEARTIKKQLYLWDQYSFRYIPVEVLSHLYQHFAQSGTGAIYTPPFVADLMLDHLLPYESITGNERILDPTCGSGVFLVGAFRRLVYHWQANHNWNRPGVPLLKSMLKRSIFGVEDLHEATHVAALNLALAVCDALQPNVIWRDLKFDTLIGRNLFQGDFFENLDNLKTAAPEGFSSIIGNPPYSSNLTPAAQNARRPKWGDIPVPDKNIAYQITEECVDLLAEGARLCLLQPSGFLYNANPRAFASRFMASHTIETVLDFVSIRNLFEAADTKALALVVRREKPAHDHEIRHLTFRKTKSVHERIGFELDHYDEHYIFQEIAETSPWIWKVNLLGGGRLANLTARVMEWPTLKEYLAGKGWSHGEGFTVGNEKNKNTWLTGMRFLPTGAITESGICKELITTVYSERFEAPRSRERYNPPMFLIGEYEHLPSGIWLDGDLSFLNSIISVNAPSSEKNELIKFGEQFEELRGTLKTLSLLKSSRALVGKSTSILKRDIEALPWPCDGEFDLAWWEDIILSDVSSIYAPLIRVGHKSPAATQAVDQPMFDAYSDTFVRLLGSVYSNLRTGHSGVADGIAYQSFIFGKSSELEWPDDWAAHLKKLIIKKSGAAFRTNRIIRFYEANTFIIVKPDRMRNWIPSTAIRDADETLVDLQEQGF